MSNDRLALKLNGDIPLQEFATAIEHFAKLVSALSDEIAGKDAVRWNVSKLVSGSAFAEVRGYAPEPEVVPRVVNAYSILGDALQHGTPIPFSFTVIEEARLLTSIINGRIHSIEFRVGNQVNTVLAAFEEATKPEKLVSFGSVTGRVGTLIDRGRLTFSLYDLHFDRAVTCYMPEEYSEVMRNAWRKAVTVVGEVYRDPETGCPLEVRKVSEITFDEPVLVSGYELARGILSDAIGATSSEEMIRRLRDDL